MEYCNCRCHNDTSGMRVRHCVPCCCTCSYCGANIKTFAFTKHEEKCKADYDKIVEEIKKNME